MKIILMMAHFRGNVHRTLHTTLAQFCKQTLPMNLNFILKEIHREKEYGR